ncbi:MbtH family protein [Streptomyces kaniharaensis]|uniref:MbtH family protein n=1 Tax=Streptomyces kaniharaensis TaxID=212423 RepID=UPI002DDD0CC8|nr:MbtH family protein [Streptomyces kaniharaensis]
MTNPFEDEEATYLVLVNEENQHSLWPASLAVPAGWTVTHGPAGRQDCLDHIENTWTDLRPASLIAALKEA